MIDLGWLANAPRQVIADPRRDFVEVYGFSVTDERESDLGWALMSGEVVSTPYGPRLVIELTVSEMGAGSVTLMKPPLP